jgi:hypothetical protein
MRIMTAKTLVRCTRASKNTLKPYVRTRLMVYGKVTELTAGGSAHANENSGAPQFRKRP